VCGEEHCVWGSALRVGKSMVVMRLAPPPKAWAVMEGWGAGIVRVTHTRRFFPPSTKP
jgi:hypothetical protein